MNAIADSLFLVVHPLDDAPETKLRPEGLAPIYLSRGARLSLVALRAYLLLMSALLAYRVFDLAGWLR